MSEYILCPPLSKLGSSQGVCELEYTSWHPFGKMNLGNLLERRLSPSGLCSFFSEQDAFTSETDFLAFPLCNILYNKIAKHI